MESETKCWAGKDARGRATAERPPLSRAAQLRLQFVYLSQQNQHPPFSFPQTPQKTERQMHAVVQQASGGSGPYRHRVIEILLPSQYGIPQRNPRKHHYLRVIVVPVTFLCPYIIVATPLPACELMCPKELMTVWLMTLIFLSVSTV